MSQFAFQVISQWPSLSWLAICRESDPTIEVLHGAGVEVTSDWFCEAVWAGAFAGGNFDDLDLVFGSGGRMRPVDHFCVFRHYGGSSSQPRITGLYADFQFSGLPALVFRRAGRFALHNTHRGPRFRIAWH